MNKKLVFALLVGYSVVIAVTCAFPTGAGDMEWYSFYSYLDKHEATPYIDVREGYPPLGFLIYEPLYHIFRDNPIAFGYGLKVLNGTFLIATLFTLYLILREQHNDKQALNRVICYAVLPSVIIANTYSNDVIALLPAALAIYMMVNKKALPCGVLLGLATLGKGFPALLLIPAFIAFTDSRDRLKLLGSTFLVLVFASLPFILMNPLTYMSTFTNVGSRGPWETLWAIGDGYYSHGGLLHPFFDKFFYHFNLLEIYPASSYDHAIYAWNIDQMPNILNGLQLAFIAIISIAYCRRKTDVLPLCGLLYIAYMLFFKGYSTQFAVSTPFYLLLAVTSMPLLYLIPLEVSHIMQMLSWNSQAFAPEFLRNEHLVILVSSVILRSIVFSALVITAFKGTNLSLRKVTSLVRRFGSHLKWLKDKWLVLLASTTMVMALVSAVPLLTYVNSNVGFKSHQGTINVTQSEWQNVLIHGLDEGDQVMVKLATNTWFDAELANSTGQVEQGVRNPYNLKSSFNETMLFFVADPGSCSLMLRMKHQKMPFRVTEGLEGDLVVNATSENSKLKLELQDEGIDGNSSIFTIAYPINTCISDDFALSLRYRIFEGNMSNIWVYVFDDTDEWLYPFLASEDFLLTSETEDYYGQTNLAGDKISLIEVSFVVNDNTSAILRMDEFKITDNEICDVKLYAFQTEEVAYQVFVEKDFRPSIMYITAVTSTIALCVLTICYMYCMANRKTINKTKELVVV